MDKDSARFNFYLTPSHDCSYLPGEKARTVFLDPKAVITTTAYTRLMAQGFRRSGGHLYRPHCGACQACIPTRVPTATFIPRRSQRRVLRANEDLRISIETAHYDDSIYALYARYVGARHDDGDMYPPTPDQFRNFLLPSWGDTEFLTLWKGEERLCIAVTDRLGDGLSAVYTFFDPAYDERSLGVRAILGQIDLARERELDWLYLGYWIKDCRKMRYKIDYRPSEMFVNGVWVRVP
ncbi:MAG: arginyltransferase [Pseudomonadales bacterium]